MPPRKVVPGQILGSSLTALPGRAPGREGRIRPSAPAERAGSPTASQLTARSATNAKCRRSRGQGVGGGKLKENML